MITEAVQSFKITRRDALRAAAFGAVAMRTPTDAARFLSSVAIPGVQAPLAISLQEAAGAVVQASPVKLIDTARGILKDQGVHLMPDAEGSSIAHARHTFPLGGADTLGLSLSGVIEDEYGPYQTLAVDYNVGGNPDKRISVFASTTSPCVARFNDFFPDFQFPKGLSDKPNVLSPYDYFDAMYSVGDGFADTGVLRQAGIEALHRGIHSTYTLDVRDMFEVDKLIEIDESMNKMVDVWKYGVELPIMQPGVEQVLEAADTLTRRGELYRTLGKIALETGAQLVSGGKTGEVEVLDEQTASLMLGLDEDGSETVTALQHGEQTFEPVIELTEGKEVIVEAPVSPTEKRFSRRSLLRDQSSDSSAV